MSLSRWIRQNLGVLLKDVPRFRRAFVNSGAGFQSDSMGWVSLCNRIELLQENPTGRGVQCSWQWGSDLAACNVWPSLGRQLMQATLEEWPICFAGELGGYSGTPSVSFIIAHAGRDRLAQLHRTIRSIFAQTDCAVEVIVVDQSPEPVVSSLPEGIHYCHLSKKGVPEGWHKSWAYNVGARLGRSDILVFQDGDVCVPQTYAREVHRTLTTDGYDAASIQRLLFYLDSMSTDRVERRDSLGGHLTPERVLQNWKGGTIAVRRDTFFRLGGFDEGFVDWGGEDDEFYDRCSAVKHCRFGYLPFVHLWHKPQSGRKQSDNPNISHVMPWRMQMPAEVRMQELSQRDFGNPNSPSPLHGYKRKFA
jgi:hypothetical protein